MVQVCEVGRAAGSGRCEYSPAADASGGGIIASERRLVQTGGRQRAHVRRASWRDIKWRGFWAADRREGMLLHDCAKWPSSACSWLGLFPRLCPNDRGNVVREPRPSSRRRTVLEHRPPSRDSPDSGVQSSAPPIRHPPAPTLRPPAPRAERGLAAPNGHQASHEQQRRPCRPGSLPATRPPAQSPGARASPTGPCSRS